MSVYFRAMDGRDLWNPGSLGARLFCDQVDSLARELSIDSGLGAIISDEVIVDEKRFKAFAEAFADFVLKLGRGSAARALCEGCFGIAGALAEKVCDIEFDESELLRLIEEGRRTIG